MKIDDIARLAEVSKSAVSLAINGKPGVSQETRDRVLRIAKEYGYNPRPVSKQQDKKKPKIFRFVACTHTGIVTEHYQSQSFFMELINNIDQSTSSKGYSLIISSVNVASLEQEIIELEKQQSTSGILLLGTNMTEQQIKVVARIQPNLVVLDTFFETLNVNSVVMNNVLGAYQAVEHLLQSGHKRIGYAASTARMYNFDMRQKGFEKHLHEHGLTVDPNHIFNLSPTDVGTQVDVKQSLQNLKGDLPSAIFCECDYMAISMIKTLNELNIRVPEDISVVGFDNILESRIINPELTTIHVKKDRIASLAVEKLIREIDHDEREKMKVFIDTELVVRRSSTSLKTHEDRPSNPLA
ncbi:LacI family transcriptional regulator [Rossellomorea marisflavi]|uniref:LacI family DNA-binding transcriptional regulator n=1 Tax=Rossellomorea marisflavi TaxID=189381 RepID=UPI0025C96779|nr:LacI family DNA-binding transcriptional regulator [Rossellomorea marisflavi]UTE73279.1 LacI family DNA-binding transcriptional regulator [Rossellomorea marisflavi]GLI84686.1 LacI family transcriptional regulator [Rossellomorea marisflavi]